MKHEMIDYLDRAINYLNEMREAVINDKDCDSYGVFVGYVYRYSDNTSKINGANVCMDEPEVMSLFAREIIWEVLDEHETRNKVLLSLITLRVLITKLWKEVRKQIKETL